MAKVRQCLGVDIGAHSIRVAEVAFTGKKIDVKALVEARLNVDVGMTEAQRHAAVATQLADLVKSSRIKTRNAVFCVSGQTVFTRRLKVPATTPDRLQRIIQFEAKEQIPFPLDQTSLEYQVFATESPTELEVLLMAMRKDQVESQMRQLKKVSLNPLAISVSSIAVHNFHEINAAPKDLLTRTEKKKAPVAKGKKKGEADAAAAEAANESAGVEFEEIQAEVNIGATYMDLAIPKAGVGRQVGFMRTVPLGGGHMDRAIRQRLNLPSLDEARRIKEQESAILSSEFELSGDAMAVNMQASQAATAVANMIVAEIRKSLEYFISQPDGVAVDSVSLSGGLSRMSYLISYIEEKLGIPVEQAKVKNGLIEAADGLAEQLPGYVIPIGLALQGLGLAQINIDFLPQDIKNVRAFTENRIPLGVAAAALAATLFLSCSVGEKYIGGYEKFAETAADLVNKAKTDSDKLSKAETANVAVSAKYEEFTKVPAQRDYLLKLAGVLFDARPPEVLVTRLDMTNSGWIRVTGQVVNANSVIKFLDDLKKSALFVRDARIDSMDSQPVATPWGNAINFSIAVKADSRKDRYRPIKEPVKAGPAGATTGGATATDGTLRPRATAPPAAAPGRWTR